VRTTCIPFEANRLQALARVSVSAHADAYNIGLVLAGLRSTPFYYLWFKPGFIPRALAAWGMIASFLMEACGRLCEWTSFHSTDIRLWNGGRDEDQRRQPSGRAARRLADS
jgi:hypothetical protein